jgi:hypothetical protein
MPRVEPVHANRHDYECKYGNRHRELARQSRAKAAGRAATSASNSKHLGISTALLRTTLDAIAQTSKPYDERCRTDTTAKRPAANRPTEGSQAWANTTPAQGFMSRSYRAVINADGEGALCEQLNDPASHSTPAVRDHAAGTDARDPRRFWWARRSEETPNIEHAPCGSCDRKGHTPFDVYCRAPGSEFADSHLLALANAPRLRIALACGAGVTLAALALWSAAASSRGPLLAAASIAGLLVTGLPLRLFNSARAIAMGGWSIVFATAAMWREGLLSPHAQRLTVAIVAAAVLVTLIVTLGISSEVSADADSQERLLASLLGCGLASAVLLGVLQLDPGAVAPRLSTYLLLTLFGLVIAGAGIVVLTGLIRGTREMRHHPPFVPPRPREAPTVQRRPSPPTSAQARTLFERLAAAMAVIGMRLVATLSDAVDAVLKGLWWLANLALTAAAHVKHTLFVWTRRALLLIRLAALRALEQLKIAALLLLGAVRAWASTLVLSLATLGAMAILTVLACGWFESYLTGATLLYGLAAMILLALASCASIPIAWALTGWPLHEISGSALHTAERAGPSVFLALVLVGWIDGLAGLLGLGPLRPGALTIAGTIIVAAVTYVYRPRDA